MPLPNAFIVLILTSGAFALLGHWGMRKFGYPPLLLAVLYPTAAVAAGICTVTAFLRESAHWFVVPEGPLAAAAVTIHHAIRLALALLIFAPPIIYSGLMLNGLIAQFLVDTVFKSSIVTRPRSCYKRAWSLAHEGRVTEAIHLFRKYYEEDPSVPDPLFYLADMLNHQQRPMEALQRYGEIMRTFEKQEKIWARAAFSCAELYEIKLHNPERARDLLETILKRTKNPDLHRLVNARLGHLPRK